MRKTVLALATFGALGAACSVAFAGSAIIPAPGPNYSPIEKIAGARLAAAAIGTAPGGISRLWQLSLALQS